MIASPGDWSVEIHEDGRCGKIIYREPAGSLSCYWEFGGGDTVVTIQVGDAASWRQQHPWAVNRRTQILQRVAEEVIRQRAPGCCAKFDDPPGWLCIQLTGTPPPITGSQPQFLRIAERKSKIMFIAAIVLTVGALVLWGVKQTFSIRVPHGTPTGDSVRVSGQIATLLQALEPYVPSLNRNPANDRYRLTLFLHPADGRSPGRLVPLAKDLTAQEVNRANLLGGDGRTLWFDVNGLGGWELATGKRIGPADLRAANPGLTELWDDSRRISFEQQRLRITLSDYRTDLEIEPATLQAKPARAKRNALGRLSGPVPQNFLCSGVRPSASSWLGLHSQREAERDFKPKSWLSRANEAADAKEMRRFYQGELGPELDRGNREILDLTPLPGEEYLNAAFVRSGVDAEPLQLKAPEGFLMVFTSAPGLAGTLVVARVNADGKLAWKVDTGIDRFKWAQILPDADDIAFIGPRPPVPDKISEPILVIIHTKSGTHTTSTLWK